MMSEGPSQAKSSRLKKFFSRSPNRDKSKSPLPGPSTGSQKIALRPAEPAIPALPTEPPALPESNSKASDDHVNALSTTKQGALASDSTATLPDVETAREQLWSKAYEDVHAEHPKLMEHFDTLVAEASNLTTDQPITATDGKHDLLQKIALRQQQRLLNRQWTWSLFGSNTRIRDSIDAILKLVNDSAALVSVGMTLAPPYVSLVWSGVCALLPFLTNNFKEQAAAIDGLHTVTKILFSYRVAEETFLTNSASTPSFIETVLPLYREVIKYQVSVSLYFRKPTPNRMTGDFVSGSRWEVALSTVQQVERHARTSTQFLGVKELKEIVSDEFSKITNILQQLVVQRNNVDQLVYWISAIRVDNDHSQVKLQLSQMPREQWILQDPQYLEWCKTENTYNLLLEGTVGQGKTSLVCGIIEDLLYKANCKLLFFYCSRISSVSAGEANSTVRNKALNCLRSLLAQVVWLSGDHANPASLQESYGSSYRRSEGGCTLSIDECVKEISELLPQSTSEWFLIIDALDECIEPKQLLTALGRLSKGVSNLKILISSREGYGDVVRKTFSVLKLLQIANKNTIDINTYIDTSVDSVFPDSGFSADQVDRLKKFLRSKAEGNFRWVELKLELIFPTEGLISPYLPKDIDHLLDELPKGFGASNKLTRAYEELLARATGVGEGPNQRRLPQQEKVVRNALMWVLCCFRPFTAHELVHASSISIDGERIEGLSVEFLMSKCANLLFERPRVGVVFAHQSVADFLKDEISEIFAPAQAHYGAAASCLHILQISPRPFAIVVSSLWLCLLENRGRSASEEPFKCALSSLAHSAIQSCPQIELRFKNYAQDYWPLHCRRTKIDDALRHQLSPSPTASFHSLIRSHDYSGMQSLVATGRDLDEPDSRGFTPLHEAVRIRDQRAVRILLLNAVDINRPSLAGFTPSLTAHYLQDTKLAQILRSAGAKDSIKDIETGLDIFPRFLSKWRNLEFLSSKVVVQELFQLDFSLQVLDQHLCANCKQIFSLRCCLELAHWETMALLEKSAAYGCRLCGLFLTGLKHDPQTEVHWEDQQLYVRLSLADSRRPYVLLVKLGREEAATFAVEIMSDPKLLRSITNILPGRPVPLRSDSQEAFNLVKTWFQACQENHTLCLTKEAVIGPTSLPTRLLDLSPSRDPDKACLVLRDQIALQNAQETDHEMGYGFLSHPFGPHVIPEAYRCMTLHPDQEIEVQSLEQSLQDAIKVFRLLNIRYMWVDKLCVDWYRQGDSKEETAKLAQYVAHATLVINAGTRDDASGLFSERLKAQTYLELDCVSNSQPPQIFSLKFREPVDIPDDAWSRLCSRAWMVQEIALARSLLVFGDDQLYWKCRAASHCEGSWLTFEKPKVDVSSFSEVQPLHRQFEILNQWYDFIEQIASKSITYFTDKLKALEGIATALGTGLSNSSRRGGLWDMDMNRGLLWYVTDSHSSFRYPEGRLPSWSWASVSSPISTKLVRACSEPSSSMSQLPKIAMGTWMDIDESFDLLTIEKAYSKEVQYGDNDSSRWVTVFDTKEDDLAWFEDETHFTAVVINCVEEPKSKFVEMSTEIHTWTPCGLFLKATSNANGDFGTALGACGPFYPFFGTAWARVGIFIGSPCEGEGTTGLDGWKKETFPLEGSSEITDEDWRLNDQDRFDGDGYDHRDGVLAHLPDASDDEDNQRDTDDE